MPGAASDRAPGTVSSGLTRAAVADAEAAVAGPAVAEAAVARAGPKQDRAVQTRDRILQAAIRVIRDDGVGNLTLDRIATAAGVSKGGFLYHFESKEALLIGLLDDTLAGLDYELNIRQQRLRAENPDAIGTFALAYLEYVEEPYKAAHDSSVSMLAAAALDNELMEHPRATFARWQERLVHEDGLSEVTGLLARIVGDGLWLIDLFGLAPPSAAERREVLKLVSRMIAGHDIGNSSPR